MTPEERAEARELANGPANGYALGPRLIAALDALEAAERERDGWTETAAQFHGGMEYYRGLCDSTAPLFGDAIYTADDGTRASDPLRAKIPELVAQHVKERDAARAQVETLAEALKAAQKWLAEDDKGRGLTIPEGLSLGLIQRGAQAREDFRAALRAAGVET